MRIWILIGALLMVTGCDTPDTLEPKTAIEQIQLCEDAGLDWIYNVDGWTGSILNIRCIHVKRKKDCEDAS